MREHRLPTKQFPIASGRPARFHFRRHIPGRHIGRSRNGEQANTGQWSPAPTASQQPSPPDCFASQSPCQFVPDASFSKTFSNLTQNVRTLRLAFSKPTPSPHKEQSYSHLRVVLF